MWGWKSRGGSEQRHMSLARIIQTPIKAFQSATWQSSGLGWSQVSLGDKTLERREDDQKRVCITTRNVNKMIRMQSRERSNLGSGNSGLWNMVVVHNIAINLQMKTVKPNAEAKTKPRECIHLKK